MELSWGNLYITPHGLRKHIKLGYLYNIIMCFIIIANYFLRLPTLDPSKTAKYALKVLVREQFDFWSVIGYNLIFQILKYKQFDTSIKSKFNYNDFLTQIFFPLLKEFSKYFKILFLKIPSTSRSYNLFLIFFFLDIYLKNINNVNI